MKFADLVTEVVEQTGGGFSETSNKDIEVIYKRHKKPSKEISITVEKTKIIIKVVK